MGIIIGVLIGYAFGTRAGPQGWDELLDAWKTISTSEEVRDLLEGSVSAARDVIGRGGDIMAGTGGAAHGTSRLRAAS